MSAVTGRTLTPLFLSCQVRAAGTRRALIEVRIKNKGIVLGNYCVPATANGFIYECTVAGTTNNADAEPVWPTVVGDSVLDGATAQWTCRRNDRRFAVGFCLMAKQLAAVNAGNVHVGSVAVLYNSCEQIELLPGDPIRMTDFGLPPGTAIDLSEVYLDADNANDGLSGVFFSALDG